MSDIPSSILHITYVYRTRFPGHKFALGRHGHGFLIPGEACLLGAEISVLLDQPATVVALDERADGLTQVGQSAIGAAMDDLLLEGSVEALGNTIGLGLLNEGVAGMDAPERDLLGEMVGQVLAAVIHAQGQTAGDAGGGGAIKGGQRQGDGLKGGVAVALLADMPANALGIPVFDRGEDPDPAVVHGEHASAVGAPQEVGGVGDDRTLVEIGPRLPTAMGRQEAVLTHQPEHPLAGDAEALLEAQPGPDLAVAPALERRCRQIGPDGGEQVGVGDRGLRAALARRRLAGLVRPRRSAGVERGPGHAPRRTHALDAVGPAGGRRGRLTHGRDLGRAKGPGRSVLARSNSTSMVSSPMRLIAWSRSAFRGSPPRSFSAVSMPDRALFRHASSR